MSQQATNGASRLIDSTDHETTQQQANDDLIIDHTRRVETNFSLFAIIRFLVGLMMRNSGEDANQFRISFRKQLRKLSFLFVLSLLGMISVIAVMIPMVYFIAGTKSLLPSNSYDRAKILASQYVPFVESHNELPYKMLLIEQRLNKPFENVFSLNTLTSKDSLLDLYRKTNLTLSTDIPRLRTGNVSAIVFSIRTLNCDDNIVSNVLKQVDSIRTRIVKNFSSHMKWAQSENDIWSAFYSRKIASLIHIDGGHAIQNSLEILRQYYMLGVRSMSLASSQCPNNWAQSASALVGGYSNGLSKFGETVLYELNKLGILVDLAHSSSKTMINVLTYSYAPVIIGHSGVKSLCNHPDNIDDDIINLVKENQGIVQIAYNPLQLNSDEWKYYNSLSDQNGTAVLLHDEKVQLMIHAQLSNVTSRSTIDTIVRHIDYVKTLTQSCDHISLGSTGFDSHYPLFVKGVESPANHMSVVAALLQKGYNTECVTKIMGGNFLRVMKRVETVSKSLNNGKSTN
ncbi:hypothetical protein C9374_012041 [Naegleria lovaniensis]|uniref:Dipeptidase n=1 Tax=Naegleria lovaniensis TaxID=51637 RepID=A0AA88KCT5_NAELO|nr:uncharacterized protein C9374_012041 [Naegleria lovaniensis]KAG2373578.1 hypothetical protein C9374_012041 [Naegleria lovaniensis]